MVKPFNNKKAQIIVSHDSFGSQCPNVNQKQF